jgi:predicted extracellular nuclease
MGQDTRYVIAGDFNDTPDSEYLAPLLKNNLGLENIVNRLPEEQRWTYFYESKKQQIDYILVPALMAGKIKGVEIGECRLKKDSAIPRCGSDHRPIFATLDL